MKYSYDELINILVDKIQSADAILVGAGSGLSASAGYTFWYEGDAVFLKEFKNFNRRYCFRGAFNGFYYRYRTPEERWAYIARLIHLLYELPTGNVYYDTGVKFFAHQNQNNQNNENIEKTAYFRTFANLNNRL